MIHDSLSNWQTYFHSNPWKCAFEFIISLNSESKDCSRIELAGKDIYAAIMTYPTCEPLDSVLETHDKYIDIQASLKNSEAIDWHPRNNLSIKNEYDLVRDRTLYHHNDPASAKISNFPGFFTVLFPQDAHMPKLMTGSKPELVKKVVVKLNIQALKIP